MVKEYAIQYKYTGSLFHIMHEIPCSLTLEWFVLLDLHTRLKLFDFSTACAACVPAISEIVLSTFSSHTASDSPARNCQLIQIY